MDDHSMVRQPGDRQQVEKARQTEKFLRERDAKDMTELLTLPAFRRFLWRAMEHCKIFESIWHPSALIHHNAGKQDVGHYLMQQVMEANPEAFTLMMVEHQQEQKKHATR